MVLVADELKKKRAEIGLRIEEMRAQIAVLEQQPAAFDVVIQADEPDYKPICEPLVARRCRKGDGEKQMVSPRYSEGPLTARPVFFVEFRRLARKHGADDFRWALTGGEHDVAGEIKRRIFLVIAYLLFHLSLGQAKHDAPYACPIDRA